MIYSLQDALKHEFVGSDEVLVGHPVLKLINNVEGNHSTYRYNNREFHYPITNAGVGLIDSHAIKHDYMHCLVFAHLNEWSRIELRNFGYKDSVVSQLTNLVEEMLVGRFATVAQLGWVIEDKDLFRIIPPSAYAGLPTPY